MEEGQILSHYTILEKLGVGGMGEVYRAEDTTLKRQVALKVLPPNLAASDDRLERFQREAQTLATLNHPHIVHVYSVEEDAGVHFLTMELVEGTRLSEVIPKGGMPLDRIFELAVPLADALASAHERGVIHRDLKPTNIMVTAEGHVKVLDFGLAKLRQEAQLAEVSALPTEPLTTEGLILGTVPYMSPEQLEGKSVDARSDIFSLGVILYEMTTGERPFTGDSSVSVISSIMKESPPQVDTLRGEVPHHLARIVRHCLEKSPEKRYQAAKDVRNELDALSIEVSSGEVPPTRVTRVPWRPASTVRRWAAAIVVAGVCSVGVVMYLGRKEAPRPVPDRPVDDVSTIPAGERLSLLVAGLENRTADPVFDGALEQALALSLEESPLIDSFQRPAARLTALELDPDGAGRLDERVARLVCVREGVQAALVGSIESEGIGYRVVLRVTESTSDQTLAEATESVVGKAEVLETVGRLATSLRSQLERGADSSSTALAQETFSTSSLEAMHAYAEAQKLQHDGRSDEAIAMYNEAIRHDPDFGRAYAGLGVVYTNLGEGEQAREHFSSAMARLDSMTLRERYRTRGAYYLLVRNYRKAVEEYSGRRLSIKSPIWPCGAPI